MQTPASCNNCGVPVGIHDNYAVELDILWRETDIEHECPTRNFS